MHRDVREPTCALCSGALVEEKKVIVGIGEGSGNLRYRRAWVCRECSAAWPIAVKTEGVFAKTSKRLYRRGARSE